MADEKLTPEERAVLREVNKNQKDHAVETSFIETPEYILEQIKIAAHATHAVSAADTKYIKYDKVSGEFDIVDRFVYSDIEYKPIVDRLYITESILLPSGVEEYGTTKDLINEIKEFLYSYFEAPPFFENFLPYIILFYWVYQKFPFVPYLHFVGLTGTGKTTAQEVVGAVCYKPIDASGSITMSPIFRTASTWQGTLLLDEFEPGGDGYSEMLSLLKSGVGNKAVLRTEGDKKRQVEVYLIKSPKIFTSERPITSAGLQSRTLVIMMKKNLRRIPLYRLNEYLEKSQSIRNKLLLWRFRNLNKIDLKDIEYGFPELTGFDRRVQQVITPIYYLSDEDTRKEIAGFAQEQETETQRERRESLEGDIFQAILDSYPVNPTLKAVTDLINKDIPSNRQYKERKVAGIIRKVFGLEIDRVGHEKINTIGILGFEPKLEELGSYFGIVIPWASAASAASAAN